MAEVDTFAEAVATLKDGDDVQYRAPKGGAIDSVRVTRIGGQRPDETPLGDWHLAIFVAVGLLVWLLVQYRRWDRR